MADVTKMDATTPCPACSGTMKLVKIEPLFAEPDMMQHTFACENCSHQEAFKFKKGLPG
jgi:C4-type Zn-finger protein